MSSVSLSVCPSVFLSVPLSVCTIVCSFVSGGSSSNKDNAELSGFRNIQLRVEAEN